MRQARSVHSDQPSAGKGEKVHQAVPVHIWQGDVFTQYRVGTKREKSDIHLLIHLGFFFSQHVRHMLNKEFT